MLKLNSARLLIGVTICLSLGFSFSAIAKNNSSNNMHSHSSISDLERVVATQEVAKVWAKHAYYHEMGLHKAEFDALWVSPVGKYAEDTAFANPRGVWYGWDTVYASYVEGKLSTFKTSLEALLTHLTDDEIEVLLEENGVDSTDGLLGMADGYFMHMQTTAVIEIAGDGQTAKGIWFSPGISQSVVVTEDGSLGIKGGWFMEKYGVDFAKENGEWKIWHMQTYYENTPDSWGATGTDLTSTTQVAQNYENPIGYQSYSATKLPVICPAIPVPYYTFDETFSYGEIGDEL